MGDTTGIAWTDHTFNPWIGCTPVSPGCDHCYAETLAVQKGWAEWGHGKPRHLMSEATWRNPYKWNREVAKGGTRNKVFCASLADVFDEEAPDSELPKLWAVIRATPLLRWQILTKRPNRIASVLPDDLKGAPNIWLGVSIEDAHISRLRRIEHLINNPAAVHFLSVEPLLGPIPNLPLTDIEWVIIGGESGPEFRPMDFDWFHQVVEQVQAAHVPLFVKQDSARRSGQKGRIPDDLWIKEFPVRTPVPLRTPVPRDDPAWRQSQAAHKAWATRRAQGWRRSH